MSHSHLSVSTLNTLQSDASFTLHWVSPATRASQVDSVEGNVVEGSELHVVEQTVAVSVELGESLLDLLLRVALGQQHVLRLVRVDEAVLVLVDGFEGRLDLRSPASGAHGQSEPANTHQWRDESFVRTDPICFIVVIIYLFLIS